MLARSHAPRRRLGSCPLLPPAPFLARHSALPRPAPLRRSDWMGKYKGSSSIAIKPKTTQQVADILRHCSERRLAVVPQGGNTGLVGGSVPVFDEVVLSLGAMNQVLSFDSVGALCRAGWQGHTWNQLEKKK